MSADDLTCQLLLVEDSTAFSGMVSETLAMHPGVTVDVVSRLDEALARLHDQPPDLALLDLGLPDSNGIATLLRVVAEAPLLPIVVLTGAGDDALRLQALKLGAQDYLIKDQIASDVLVRSIEHALERSKAILAARASDAHLRLVVGQLPVALWSTDTESRVTSSAGAALRQLNVKDEELVGIPLAEYLGDAQSPVLDLVRRALAGESIRYEKVLFNRLFQTDMEPLRDDAGRIVGTVALSVDITERKHRIDQLEGAYTQLRHVSNRLLTVREHERSRLARDLHDHFSQSLTALKMDVAAVRRRLAEGDLATADSRLAEMSELLDSAAQDVRQIATELRPALLDELGLVAATESYLVDVQRRTGVRCKFINHAPALTLEDDRASVVFRILQEAMTNAIRHADAATIAVTLATTAGQVLLTIHDDGCGIREDALEKGQTLGIIGMRDRALLFDGHLTITGGPGKGTTVSLQLPSGQEAQ